MQTLADRINRSYSEYDLSDNTFEYRETDWRNYVPFEIKQIWNILQEDERFLIALTAESNIR